MSFEDLCVQSYQEQLQKITAQEELIAKRRVKKELDSINHCRESLKEMCKDDFLDYLEAHGHWEVDSRQESILSVNLYCKVADTNILIQYKDNRWVYICPQGEHHLEYVNNVREFLMLKIGAILCQI